MTLDVAIGLQNLNFLAEENRLQTIPEKAPRGASLRLVTDTTLRPQLKIPKQLPSDPRNWDTHLRDFWNFLSARAAHMERLLAQRKRVTEVTPICTENVYLRGLNLVNSGNIAHISVGPDASMQGCFMVRMKIYPRLRTDYNLVCLRMVAGDPLASHACSCIDGYVFWHFLFIFNITVQRAILFSLCIWSHSFG